MDSKLTRSSGGLKTHRSSFDSNTGHFLKKGWFRPFEINPVMGIKGRGSRLAARRAQRKTHRIRSCLSAQGQLLRVWRDRDRRYIAGFLTWKQGREFYGSAVRAQQEQVLHLSAGGSSNRKEGIKGQKEVRKTTRAANSGPCPKGRDGKCTPRSP